MEETLILSFCTAARIRMCEWLFALLPIATKFRVHFPMVAMGDKTCFLLCESVGRSVKDVLASPLASGSQNCPFIQSNINLSISKELFSDERIYCNILETYRGSVCMGSSITVSLRSHVADFPTYLWTKNP